MRFLRLLLPLTLAVTLFAPASAYAWPFAAADFVVGPTTPGKWGGPVMGTPGGTVTWSLMATGVPTGVEGAGAISALADFMPAGFLAEVTAAFAAWSAVADIDFMMVPDGGAPFNDPGPADIRIGGHAFDGPFGVLAHGYFPPANGTTAAGDIHFDTSEAWKIGFGGPGFNIFQVMAHEIGHAIGLDHTGVPGSLMNPSYTEAFAGPQADDIAGAVFIYGAAPIDEPAPVPEPSTFLLLGAGVLALVRMRQRRAQ